VLFTFVETNLFMKSWLMLSFFFGFLLISGCAKDKTAIQNVPSDLFCDSIPPSFATIVYPIFEQNCIGCHTASNPQGGYNIETHALIVQEIQPILNTINHRPGAVPMPYQMNKLNDSLIGIITCWKDSGMPNN